MKKLTNITHKNKETYFNLLISDILKKIDEEADEWFHETFIDHKDYIPKEILERNLKMNLDYLFSEAIWLIELGESLGFEIDFKCFLESKYKQYTKDEYGYRLLVNDRRYDSLNHRALTKRQATLREKRINKIAKEYLQNL